MGAERAGSDMVGATTSLAVGTGSAIAGVSRMPFAMGETIGMKMASSWSYPAGTGDGDKEPDASGTSESARAAEDQALQSEFSDEDQTQQADGLDAGKAANA